MTVKPSTTRCYRCKRRLKWREGAFCEICLEELAMQNIAAKQLVVHEDQMSRRHMCTGCCEPINPFDGLIVRGDILMVQPEPDDRDSRYIEGFGGETFWHERCLVEAIGIDPREWLCDGGLT